MHRWAYTPTHRGFDTFFGYYGAFEDHYDHSFRIAYPDPTRDSPSHVSVASGLDFRNNEDPYTPHGYSTEIFTRAMQTQILSHSTSNGDKPLFLYGAYQAMHDPLEVPEKYLEKCSAIPCEKRKMFCGMMQAVDEGIKNITMTLESEGYLDNTIIILTTDNGGQTGQGSSNWPLRGNKGTVFEGGVRGFSFVWGKELLKKKHRYSGLMHISDWYRTIVEGIAGLDSVAEDVDGNNMWQAMVENDISPRKEILLQLNPPDQDQDHPHLSFVGQAALRFRNWKLIMGEPGCRLSIIDTINKCPTGWVQHCCTCESVENPPDNPSQTWLFNLDEDPNERNDVHEKYPTIVELLTMKIEAYGSTKVEQPRPRFDPASDPKNFGGVWTPWMSGSLMNEI